LKIHKALGLAPLVAALATGCSSPDEDAFHVDPDTGLTLRAGFDADLVYTIPKEQGSWVAMAFDPKGRLIVSDQDDKGVFRVTLPEPGQEGVEVEPLEGFPFEPVAWGKRTVAGALGFLWAFDSLYMSTMRGFYRVRDTDGDDQFDEFTLLERLYPGWEHSAHTIVLTEDGQGLYLVSGNHSRVPDGVTSVQPEVWGEDALIPPLPDPRGHAVGIGPPGGWICRISPDGSDWKMVAMGFRNSVDLAINRHGELFTADSDLEFDIGSPWYRPTRVNHVTSGAEFGWRTGSAKWPDHYPDSLGSVVDLGPGSPTGITFGHGSGFPERYQDTLFVADWTFGSIYAIDLEDAGASYRGTKSVFLSGTPLNITAMRFGPDGHLYFVIGGRNTDSKLYRVRYVGEGQPAPSARSADGAAQRDLRRSLEALHVREDATAALDAVWPHLGSDDRAIRYAARIAVECQPVAAWQERVLATEDPRAAIHGVVALCRHAGEEVRGRVVDKLVSIDQGSLSADDRLDWLRAWSLCLIRLGDASPDEITKLLACVSPLYPSGDATLDAELCRVLCSVDAPDVVEKTLALMRTTEARALAYDAEMLGRHEYGKPILEAMANTPNTQNIHFAYCLRQVQGGWTLDRRKEYFGWLREQLQKSGGLSFEGYIRAIRDDAIAHLPESEVAAIAWMLDDPEKPDAAALPTPVGPGGAWTLDTALALFDGELRGRDRENGEKMFAAGRCVLCHRFAGRGGHSGPDLGSVGQRFSVRDILTAICEPSQTIAEQFQASIITRKDGSQIVGRIIIDDGEEVAVATNPFDFSQLTRIPAADVQNVELSPVSLMPPAMIAGMNAEEVRDLVAYLVSGGDKKHRVFARD